jgi:hypothetical protein
MFEFTWMRLCEIGLNKSQPKSDVVALRRREDLVEITYAAAGGQR